MTQRKTNRRKRGPKPVTEAGLEAAALRYLDRYASSSANLRRILTARVVRAARLHETDLDEAGRWIEALIARLTASGLLDDAAYAAARARSLHRRGISSAGLRARLSAKGLDRALIAETLETLAADQEGFELSAALALVRRRRIGPFRTAEDRGAFREKDLAALGRQGFAYDIARRVIDTTDLSELEAEAQSRL
ncbi:MAG: RecX family transcriptional regulator [Pseudomonadota bacterium]